MPRASVCWILRVSGIIIVSVIFASTEPVHHPERNKGICRRVFTTREQLVVSEEKEAELAAQVQQAQQVAAAAQLALAAQAQATEVQTEATQAVASQVRPPSLRLSCMHTL